MLNLKAVETIRNQISIATHMACGSREFAHGDSNGIVHLIFKVGGYHQTQWIKVYSMPNDTYKVEMLKLNRKSHKINTIESQDNVYCDQLSEIVYRMVNK